MKARTDGILGRDGGGDEAKETAREMETEKEKASLRENEELPMVNFLPPSPPPLRSRSRTGAEQETGRKPNRGGAGPSERRGNCQNYHLLYTS